MSVQKTQRQLGSFALILSTINRTSEVSKLLKSLCEQTFKKFHVILVDQNSDGRLNPVVDDYSSRLSILHLSSPRGLSKGRNAGLALIGEASFVSFPDDDCIYPPDVLEKVAGTFARSFHLDALTGVSVTSSGVESNNRWHQVSGQVTADNVWNRSTSFTIFVRTAALENIRFDESLGVGAGTPWGSAEDVDFVLQLLSRKRYVYFDRNITVQHPEWTSNGYNSAAYGKAGSYARGMGRVLRKHRYPLYLVIYHLIRPVGGSLIALLRGRFAKARWHWSMFVGRLHGCVARPDTLTQPPSGHLLAKVDLESP